MFNGKAMFPGTSTTNQLERVMAWTGPPKADDLKQLNMNLPSTILQMLNTRKRVVKSDLLGGKVSPQCLDLISRLL